MPLYIFAFAVYLLVLCMCAQIRVWLCMCLLLYVIFFLLRSYGQGRLLSIACVYTFSASICTAHYALDLARDHAP